MTTLHALRDTTEKARLPKSRAPVKLPHASFVEVASAEAAAPFLEGWERLADAPLERNVFAEPWMLLPALDRLTHDEDAKAGLAFDPSSNELLGVFPFVRSRYWNHLPITVVSAWVHEQSYLGTPLLHKDPVRAKQALNAFLEEFASVPLVEFNDVAGDGEFMHLLMEVIGERKLAWLLTDSVTRPVLRPRDSADAYLTEALDGDARRKLRSKERGLAALGVIGTETVESLSALEVWIADFIRLEASGWKGKQSSALLHDPEACSYFEAIVRDGFRRGRIMALTLRSGDRIAAMKLNLRSGDEWFAFKIAYEQELARFSPSARARQRAMDGLVYRAERSSLSGRVARPPLHPEHRHRDGSRAGRIGAFVLAAPTLGKGKNAGLRRPPRGTRDLQAAATASRDASIGKPSAPIEKARRDPLGDGRFRARRCTG
jgi:CelD/BcsL family acetyltransferase involved in cellulose biosynthesis